MVKHICRVFSFILIMALCFAMIFPVSSYADFRLDSSFQTDYLSATPVDALGTAFVTRAALGALGVEIAGSLLSLTPEDVVRAMWSGGGSTLPPNYTYSLNLVEYLSRQVIRIRPDSVTIGGVDYSDVWLPHDAADKFRTNAFDFITRFNLISESNGTFVSGVGMYDGIPVYNVNGSLRSADYIVPISRGTYRVGNVTLAITYVDNTSFNGRITLSSGNTRTGSSSGHNVYNAGAVFRTSATGCNFGTNMPGTGPVNSITINDSSVYVNQAFDFTWTSSVIPADPLPTEDGLRLRVPSSIVSSLPQILDPDSSSYDADLASLISGIESSASAGTLTDPAFEAWDTPVPPASNTIAEEPYSSLSSSLSGIKGVLDSVDTFLTNLGETIENSSGYFFQTVVGTLQDVFSPVLNTFKSVVSIWRYVVGWVGNISAPLSWSMSALGSAGGYFLSPIYAASAGAIVIAIYRRLGK